MMNMTHYLEVTGALRGGPHDQPWFHLPRSGRLLQTFRFGGRAFVLNETMQILPSVRAGQGATATVVQPAASARRCFRLPTGFNPLALLL